MRGKLPLAMLAVAPLLALSTMSAPIAGAARLDGGPFDWTSPPGVTGDLCSFPVTVVNHMVGRFVLVATGNGFVEEDTAAEQDTFTANGTTLVSNWYHFRVGGTYDAEFNITSEFSSGEMMRVTLPDGTQFKSAGLYRFVPLHPEVAFAITPDRGHSGDVAALCAALS